jgi:NAD(P)-dependent dehydrogenase (short-subunit alcohol dehydrogenase family)
MESLRSKIAVVTGAGSGIGRATALALARQGAVVALADLDASSAKETAALLDGVSGTSVHQVDVASESAMRALVEDVIAEHGAVDVVVNNAGIAPGPGAAQDLPLPTYRRIMDVNYWGMVYGSLFFLPHLLTRPEANLVNVASNAAIIAYPRLAPYSASKFAIRGFSEALRMELRKTRVQVTVVCPGSTHTKIIQNSPVVADSERERLQERFDKTFGRPPEAVAEAIVRAIRQNRPRALAGPDTLVFDALARIAPATYGRWLAPAIERFIDSATRQR